MSLTQHQPFKHFLTLGTINSQNDKKKGNIASLENSSEQIPPGTHHDSRRITCNGKLFWVRQNLFDALEQFTISMIDKFLVD